MGEGLKRAFAAARATQKPKKPVETVDRPLKDIVKSMSALIHGGTMPAQIARDLEKLCVAVLRSKDFEDELKKSTDIPSTGSAKVDNYLDEVMK